jgi:hypothetical protein
MSESPSPSPEQVEAAIKALQAWRERARTTGEFGDAAAGIIIESFPAAIAEALSAALAVAGSPKDKPTFGVREVEAMLEAANDRGFRAGIAVERGEIESDDPDALPFTIEGAAAAAADLQDERPDAFEQRLLEVVTEERNRAILALAELIRLKELKNEPRTREEEVAYRIAKEDAWQVARAALVVPGEEER